MEKIKTYKQKLLNTLYEPFKDNPPVKNLSNNVVFGEGNPDANLMFLGEAPGRDEDIQGRPFVGRSGQLLRKVIESTGISCADIFITNIVNCRPPNNRKPTPAESKTCKAALLENQLKIIQPKIICTVGAAPLEGLLEHPVKITQVRGKIIEHGGYKILPTYHPAYILRNRKELETFMRDVNRATVLSQ